MKRRRQTKQHAGDDADTEEESERPPVHGEDHPERPANVLQFRVEPADTGHREQETERASHEREQHALREELPDDLPAGGADRDAHAHLPRPPRGTREQEVGDIGAGNQQHESDRAQQRPEQQPDLRSDDQALERIGIRREVLVAVGILAGQCPADGVQLGPGLFERDAVRKPSDGEEIPRLARLLAQRRRVLRHRKPDLLRLREPEALLHDPDHGRGDAIEADLSPQHTRVAAVPLLPHGVGQHDHRRSARNVVFRTEIAPENRRDADHLVVVGRDVGAWVLFGDAALVGHVEGAAEDDG